MPYFQGSYGVKQIKLSEVEHSNLYFRYSHQWFQCATVSVCHGSHSVQLLNKGGKWFWPSFWLQTPKLNDVSLLSALLSWKLCADPEALWKPSQVRLRRFVVLWDSFVLMLRGFLFVCFVLVWFAFFFVPVLQKHPNTRRGGQRQPWPHDRPRLEG